MQFAPRVLAFYSALPIDKGTSMKVLTSRALPSLCPISGRKPRKVCIGLVQTRWYESPDLHIQRIHEGVSACAEAGASVVFLPELTLNRYPADTKPVNAADTSAEDLLEGPSFSLASDLARECDVHVQISLFEKSGAADRRGLNTSVIVSPNGEKIGHTHKLHIPITEGYFEDYYFSQGSADNPYPVHTLELDGHDLKVGNPTCWDEWFPEVARSYALAGADLLCYPTAIGSEPDYPDFDTSPMLHQVIIGHAIANGLFIAVPNRFGFEGRITFYGRSLLVDPFGRIIIQAERDEETAIVAEIDLGQRDDWLNLFPFFATRRPDTYGKITEEIMNSGLPDGQTEDRESPGIGK